jgi:hypothetical protein
MNELNKYKEVWQNQNVDNQLDHKSLNLMIHKKSSSVVKWIFYISLIEFGLIIFLNLVIPTDLEQFKAYGLYQFMRGLSLFGYILTLFFIYLFYNNYKNISVSNATKELIKSILNTRKTVKYYIFINLFIITTSLFYIFYIILQSDEYLNLMEKIGENGFLIVWSIVVFAILFIVGLMLGFYLLVYGIFIKRLNQNYKELIQEE